MHFQNYFIEQFAQLDRHLVEGQINMALELEEKLRVKLKDVERQYPEVLPHLAEEQVRTKFLQGRKDRLAAQQKYLRHQFAPYLDMQIGGCCAARLAKSCIPR